MSICDYLISDKDIKSIYNIQEINRKDVDTLCDDNETKSSIINIFNSSEQINDSEIVRFYYKHKKYMQNENFGKVVKHFQCYFKSQFQTNNLATKLLKREKDIYAKTDGVVVWRRLGFEYLDDNIERLILTSWREYLTDEYKLHNIDKKEYFTILNKTKSIIAIPKEYLYDDLPVGVLSFTIWYNNKVNNSTSTKELSIKMYYDLNLEVA